MCFGPGTDGGNLKACGPTLMKWKWPLRYMELYNLLFGNLWPLRTCLAENFPPSPAVPAYEETEVWYGRQRSKCGQNRSAHAKWSEGEIVPGFLWFAEFEMCNNCGYVNRDLVSHEIWIWIPQWVFPGWIRKRDFTVEFRSGITNTNNAKGFLRVKGHTIWQLLMCFLLIYKRNLTSCRKSLQVI